MSTSPNARRFSATLTRSSIHRPPALLILFALLFLSLSLLGGEARAQAPSEVETPKTPISTEDAQSTEDRDPKGEASGVKEAKDTSVAVTEGEESARGGAGESAGGTAPPSDLSESSEEVSAAPKDSPSPEPAAEPGALRAYGGFEIIPPAERNYPPLEIAGISTLLAGGAISITGGLLWGQDYETAGPLVTSLGTTTLLAGAALIYFVHMDEASEKEGSSSGAPSESGEIDPSTAPSDESEDSISLWSPTFGEVSPGVMGVGVFGRF